MDSLFDKLLAAGCKMDSHESDLYVEATDTTRRIVKEHGVRVQGFISDGKTWLEIPFMYDPWWNARA